MADERDIHWENLQAALAQLENAVDQLTAVLPQDRRELFLRLMVTLGLEESNPLLPIFVGLQFYVEYLKTVLSDMRTVVSAFKQELPAEIRGAADESLLLALSVHEKIQNQLDRSRGELYTVMSQFRAELPAEIRGAADESLVSALSAYGDIQSRIDASLKALRGAADESLGKALKGYGGIQSQIDAAVGNIDQSVEQIDQIRKQWYDEAVELQLAQTNVFSQQKEEEIEVFRVGTEKVKAETLDFLMRDLASFRKTYLKNVLKLAYGLGAAIALVVLLAVGWTAYSQGLAKGEKEACKAILSSKL